MGYGEAAVYALRAFHRHGLSRRWKFALGNSRQEYGSCDFSSRTIEVSRVFLKTATRKESIDTILHEIAHALAGTHLHNKKWKSIAERIGARPLAQPKKYGEKTKEKRFAAESVARASKARIK